MFTGLVEERGTVIENNQSGRTAELTVSAPLVHVDAKLGDSIAINGCCLTVIAQDGDRLTFEAVPETMARTNLGDLRPGEEVNLERPLAIGSRLGGHFVQGHVDGVGTVLSFTPDENAIIIEIGLPAELRKYVVFKGSITVDGVSLTIAETRPASFTVWTIPHTREVTTLGCLEVGDKVNLECDMLGKYVEHLLAERAIPSCEAGF